MDFPRQAHVSLNGLITTDTVHSRVHSGSAYFCVGVYSLANDANENWYLAVESNTYVHFREASASGTGAPLLVTLYEDAIVSSIGGIITPYNLNRASASIPTLAVSRAPVVTTTGTMLDTLLIPGAKQQGTIGDLAKIEWVLKPGKNYLVSFTNQSGGSIRINPNIFWYEVN